MREEKTSLKFKAGGVFFIVNSFLMGYFATLMDFYSFQLGEQINSNQVSIPFLVLTITHFFGGFAVLFDKKVKGMAAIFIANILVLLLFLTYISMLSWSYFNHPCYIDPAICDDELTDTPFYLKAIGLLVTIFALITFMSWRMYRSSIPTNEER